MVVSVGALASLALGLALVSHLPYRSLSDTWIAVCARALGRERRARRDRRAVHPCRRGTSRSGWRPAATARSDELHRRLADPVSLALNYGSLLAALALLALMIWKPA